MNLAGIDLPQFLIKLKGLVKKISNTCSSQIISHTEKCHSIITELIGDQNILQNLESQQLRLLAYESVLFLVEIIKIRQDKKIYKEMKKNKIEGFLCQIYETLASIKQLINDMQQRMSGNSLIKNGTNYKPMNMNQFDRLHSNLNVYQQKIGKIVSQFESENQIKPDQPLKNKRQPNQQNDLLIEQMHRIIQKKQQKINQFTKSLQKLNQQKLDLELSLNHTLNQLHQNNHSLLTRIQKFELEKKQLIQNHQESKENLIQSQKQKIQNRLCINQTVKQQIIKIPPSYQNILFENPIQTITESTIPSTKSVQKLHVSPRKFSLEKVGSNKSFRRICFGDDKDSISVDKKYCDILQKNQQLYRLLLCQASTIEELI